MQRTLIFIGILIILIGVFWKYVSRIPLGRLPGDIIIRRDNFTFYFPVVTMIIISVIITVIVRVWNGWGK